MSPPWSTFIFENNPLYIDEDDELVHYDIGAFIEKITSTPRIEVGYGQVQRDELLELTELLRDDPYAVNTGDNQCGEVYNPIGPVPVNNDSAHITAIDSPFASALTPITQETLIYFIKIAFPSKAFFIQYNELQKRKSGLGDYLCTDY